MEVGDSRSGWGFVKEIVDELHFLQARISRERLFTLKMRNLDCDLTYLLSPTLFCHTLSCDWPGENIVSGVRKLPMPPSTKTFFLKLQINILPFKTWLH